MARYYKDRKHDACERCLPDGGAILSKTWDFLDDSDELVPVWECRNCGNVTKRITRSRGTGRTPSQDKALARLRKQILHHDGLGDAHKHKYEYKQWEVTDTDHGNVLLYTRVGRKDARNSLADTIRHISIGRRGGLHLLNATDKNIRGDKVVYWTTR